MAAAYEQLTTGRYTGGRLVAHCSQLRRGWGLAQQDGLHLPGCARSPAEGRQCARRPPALPPHLISCESGNFLSAVENPPGQNCG